ncbi:FecR family protein [Ancylobacter sp. Lp-2]|uniref:FecR family protein n=1 Tax=Ancylobacter sp. Lp-2 TaxID=2881339 RepID=UPI001E649A07|nr:FecR family protein [Ancylobacter sp. Lp-2]MCB4767890.1 FecR family protein [Ancylobacter sp. Lp-2]
MERAVSESGQYAEDVEQRAAEWVARLDGSPLSDGEKGALRAWLGADPEHRAAFEEASATWRELGALRHDPGPLRTVLTPPRQASAARKAVRIGALVGLLVLAAGAARFQFGDPWLMLAADYRTAPGELRTISLPDGSTVELGPSSAIALAYGEDERRVRLLVGEAFFTVAPRAGDESRPFVAEAAGGTTTALGTKFVIEESGDAADVLAVEHQVEVASGAATRDGVVLSPGQEVRYRSDGRIGRIRTRDIATATAWRRGMLVFNGARLGHVVETLNRYRRGRIVILETELAQRRVSGVFPTSDLDDAIDTITTELGIGSRSIYPLITVLY